VSVGKCSTDGFSSDKVKQAGRTTYAMMDVRLHGCNGLNALVSLHICKTYVLSRMMYSLDAITIKHTDRKVLVQYHKLKQLQFLPDRTADVGVYKCLGELPLDADIDRKSLSL